MKKYKVVFTDHEFGKVDIERKILNPIGAEVIDLQSKDPETIKKHCRDADALLNLYAKLTSDVIKEFTQCKIIVRLGVGFDNVDLPTATEKGIYVANVRDYGNHEVSTHAIALLLSCARKTVWLNDSTKKRNWSYSHLKPIYRLWENQVLGLVGFGKIARYAAKKAQAFGLKVYAFDPFVSAKEMHEMDVTKKEDLGELLSESDFVSVHAPLNKDTYHMISVPQFRMMKQTAYIINTARGSVIDEGALYKAVKENWIAGAGLDVMEQEPPQADNPLLDLENIIITPHTAYYSEESLFILRETAAKQIVEVLKEQKPPRYLVNTGVIK